jgi:IS1 family transposase
MVVVHYVGCGGIKSAKKLWKRILVQLRHCEFEPDNWKAYKKIIPSEQHKIGKDLTYYIEGFNATIRARVSRLVRKTLSFSKKDKWHKKAIAWFFWQFNLELV